MTPALSDADIASLNNFRLQNFKNVFTIGMNSGVVSFYSQQCRAFQLAVTLNKAVAASRKADMRVAVLGGGVAGVTFWMALQVLGFERSEIFEATHQLLNRQSKSAHRFAHPSINEWPNVGKGRRPFRSTTSWPFANWYASTADDVVRQLRDDGLLRRFLVEKETLVRLGHVIHGIADASDHSLVPWPGADRLPDAGVGLSFHTPLGDDSTNFHVVVSALGYGYERDLTTSDSKSYWWTDHIGHYSQERHEYGSHAKLVSGTGDGGLIDCIRFALAPGSAPDHNVALEIAAFARKSVFKTLDIPIPAGSEDTPSELESTLTKQFEEHFKRQATAGATRGKTKGNDEATSEEIALRTKLRSIFEGLFQDPGFTRLFVKGDELKRIGLVARSGRVFSVTSSIANQILVAFLWGQHHELILRGASIDQRKLVNCPPKAKSLVSGQDAVMVLRHGAKSKLEELVGVAAAVTVEPKGQDSVIFEQSSELDGLRAKVAVLLGNGADTTHGLSVAFANRYFEGATSLMETDMDGRLSIRIALPSGDVNDQVYRKLGGFDPEAFGFPLHYSKGHLDHLEFGSYDD